MKSKAPQICYKITVAYVRVSTNKQLEGNGPEQQRQSIVAWACARGVKIDDWVIEDESGTKEDREEILRLKELAYDRKLGRIVVDRMDRLGRRLLVCEQLHAEFRGLGVEIVSTQMEADNGPTGTLMRQMMGAIAEYQRSEWLARMRACRKAAVSRKGRWSGGTAPLGYRAAGDGRLEIEPEAALIVRRAFEHLDSGLGYHATAEALTKDGILTSTGRPFAPMQVKRIADRRKFYEGKAPLQDIAYEAGVIPSHPAILKGDRAMHAEGQHKAAMG